MNTGIDCVSIQLNRPRKCPYKRTTLFRANLFPVPSPTGLLLLKKEQLPPPPYAPAVR